MALGDIKCVRLKTNKNIYNMEFGLSKSSSRFIASVLIKIHTRGKRRLGIH